MNAIDRKGWCPGALRPMASGDGLIVRARPRTGALRLDACRSIGAAAERWGNGQIDVTRRGNLQIRGVDEKGLAAIHDVLAGLDLLDGSAEGEAVRNVLVAPLAGLDPEAVDVRPVASALEERLIADPTFHRLPGKFGFIVDGGGHLSVAAEAGDIVIAPDARRDEAVIALRRRDGLLVVARTAWTSAAEGAGDLARRLVGELEGRRVRDVPEERIRTLFSHAQPLLAVRRPHRAPLGALRNAAGPFAVGFAPPLGRISGVQLAAMANALALAGCADVRLSPWRAIFAGPMDDAAAARILDTIQALGFLVDPSHPLLRIDACPGAPACPSARLETRALAGLLAGALDQLGIGVLHVSGCAKGCARSDLADVVLTGTDDGIALIRHGTASSRPEAVLAPHDIVGALAGATPHA